MRRACREARGKSFPRVLTGYFPVFVVLEFRKSSDENVEMTNIDFVVFEFRKSSIGESRTRLIAAVELSVLASACCSATRESYVEQIAGPGRSVGESPLSLTSRVARWVPSGPQDAAGAF